MGSIVSETLRRFLPGFMRSAPALGPAQRRAARAITHCRTPAMGGALHVCGECGRREFAYHSCNHRSCPLCGRAATGEWVARELGKRVGAPYFMVTFTVPAELRSIFFGPGAKEAYDMFFASSARALREKLAAPKSLGAAHCGFTGVLHTWNQRLLFHPHIHCIVPGAGIDAGGRVVAVKSAQFLTRVEGLAGAFRAHFREAIRLAGWAVDPAAWNRKWGVHIKPFGSGANAIKYLGAYVCRTAIGDSRILSTTREEVSFRWKDRSRGGRLRVERIAGEEFVRRYLRHALPRGMRAVRYFGFCHPASKKKRERVAFHTGRPIFAGPVEPAPKPDRARRCPCCAQPMIRVASFPATYFRAACGTASRAPPAPPKR